MQRQGWQRLYTITVMAAVCILAALACTCLYLFDNKYTAAGPQAVDGILTLDEQLLEEYPVVFLTEGWEYYSQRLLTPDDFTSKNLTPDAIIFIGQYGGFDAGDLDAPPHGCASYRLTIVLPDQPRQYLLELPEVYSAYRAYANGQLVSAMGDPYLSSYHPETGNHTVTIEAAGQIELLIAVADYSHIFSGLTYPPAFGQPEAVGALLSTRLIFRSLLVAFALAIGITALLVGVASRANRQAALFGLLCLFFVGHAAYPIVKTLTSAFYPLYVIEGVSFAAMLLAVIQLHRDTLGRQQRWDWCLVGFGALVCLASLALPFLLPGASMWLIAGYSWLVLAYEWATAAYLTATAGRALWQGLSHSPVLTGGILVFDVALVADRVLTLHEPIVLGWFYELASFVLVLSIGVVVGREVVLKYRDSAVLSERMSGLERQAQMQQTSFALIEERIEQARSAQHDLKHHFIAIEGFLQQRDFESLEAYVRTAAPAAEAGMLVYSQNPLVNVLAMYYDRLAREQGVRLTLHLQIGPECPVSDPDLSAVLSNLLENALEACTRQIEGERHISLSISEQADMLAIRVENSFDSQVVRRGGAFLSTKTEGRKGYGLDSVSAIAKRYNGEAYFEADSGRGIFKSTVVLGVR